MVIALWNFARIVTRFGLTLINGAGTILLLDELLPLFFFTIDESKHGRLRLKFHVIDVIRPEPDIAADVFIKHHNIFNDPIIRTSGAVINDSNTKNYGQVYIYEIRCFVRR